MREEKKKREDKDWLRLVDGSALSTVLSVVCCGHRGAPRAPL